MALIDLQSDLSKFRAEPKKTGDIKPENSSARTSRVFGSFQPITARLSTLQSNVKKPTNIPLESKLDSTTLDDIVKNLKQDLIINSVSRYSPTNTMLDKTGAGRLSLERIVSKFSDIPLEQFTPKLAKSNVLILRSDAGGNNNTSPIELDMATRKTFDRKNQSPAVFAVTQTDTKDQSSPDIQKNSAVDSTIDPDIEITRLAQSSDLNAQSPDVFDSTLTSDKGATSPTIPPSKAVSDKSQQSPELFVSSVVRDKTTQSPEINPTSDVIDKSTQSPDLRTSTLSVDRSTQSPAINPIETSIDFEGQSKTVAQTGQTPDKTISSPDIFVKSNDSTDNIVNPDVTIVSPNVSGNIENPNTVVEKQPLSFDRNAQSVLINKDLVSPINNIINPNVVLDQNELVFDRAGQSPEIFKNTPVQGLVVNPNTTVVRIEQGTYHLIDESRLNVDGIPLRFETTSRLQTKTPNQPADTAARYSGTTNFVDLHSQLNLDGKIRNTVLGGRHLDPSKSTIAIKGLQAVNFFDDTNATGFTRTIQKGVSNYKQNSEFSWVGSNAAAPTTNFFQDQNGTGFTAFPQIGVSQLNTDSSKFTFTQKNGVDYFDRGKLFTKAGFTINAIPAQSEFQFDASKFGWKGDRQQAASLSNFTTFPIALQSKIAEINSGFKWSGNSTSAPAVNFIPDLNALGFHTFASALETKFDAGSTKLGFSSTRPTPVNFFTNTNASGFTINAIQGQSQFDSETSQYTFRGNGSQSPEVNFFLDRYNAGFKRQTLALQSTFKQNTSRFTWAGTRQEAPEVNFFYIPGENPNAIPGFTRLFTDKSTPKLSDKYSRLSFAGTTVRSTIRPVPYTTYFGFTSAERTGFMVNMSTFDGTLYPTISPTLNYNADPATRTSVEIARAIRGGMNTRNNEKYAPNSLGPRPWVDGTLFSTLDAQIPAGQIKTGADASSYKIKYERSLKDGTSNLGFLTKWATTRRSPSPLDGQYSKYKLRNEAVNRETSTFDQPFVVRGIQRDGEVENQRWGFGVTFDDGIIRGGAITHAERIAMDVVRIGKWSLSMKGILWNIKQFGLQAMNPVVDINPAKPEAGIFGVSSTLVYNPLSLIGNVAGASLGIRLPRHGIVPFSISYLNKYEDATVARELKHQFTSPDYTAFETLTRPTIVNRQTSYNRLIGLMKELLPNSFKPVVAKQDGIDSTLEQFARQGIELANQLTGQTGINRISSNFGGPQSFFGIGGTQIKRAHHPYLTHYTTTPLLMLTGEQKEPQFPTTAKRDTYYAATSMYKDSFGDVLRTIAYNLPNGPYEKNDENLPRSVSKIKQVQPSGVSRIEKQNPFAAQYDLFKNRLRAVSDTDVYKNGNLSDGPHPDNTDAFNPIKIYRSLAYDKLTVSRDRRRAKNGTTGVGEYNDFRADLNDETGNLKTFSTDPAVADFAANNLEDRHGFGKHGKAGVDRSKPYQNTISYAKKNGVSVPKLKDPQSEFRGDRINIIDYKRGKFDISKDFVYETGTYNNPDVPGAEDLVEFYFTGVQLRGTESRPAEAIAFRATFGSISDSHAAEWSRIGYMGRADPLYVYQAYQRDISFDFTVVITSRDELKASWRKLNHLASWTAPEYTKSGFIRGPIVRLNIGNLYRKMPGFLESIRYNFDNNETTWETAKLKDDLLLDGANGSSTSPGALQLPKMIRVDCVFVPIGVYRPEYNGILYSLYDDSAGGGLENGLVPNNDVRVNYFKSYDVDSAGSPQTNDSSDNRRYYRIPPGEESVVPDIIPESRENLSVTNTSTNSDGTQNAATVPNTTAGSVPGNTTQNVA